MANSAGDTNAPLTDSSTHNVTVSLDEEIEELQRAISQRRQSRNALQPISRLPPEVLVHIFKLIQSQSSSFGRDAWNWLTLTKICVYWRKLIIDAPIFWTKVGEFDSIKRIKVFLERSQDAGLEVKLQEDDLVRGAFDLIKEHIGRVKQLRVYYKDGSRLWSSLQSLFMDPNSCTLLKHITIISDFTPYIPRQVTWISNEVPVRLDRLELWNVYTPWNHSIFRGLRVLCINNINDPLMVPHCPTLSQFLDILDSCGELEELDLRLAGPSFSYVSRDRIVNLPRLAKISIDGVAYRTYLALFQHMQLSKVISCHIHCSDYDFATTNPLIAPSLKHSLPNRYSSLCVELCEDSVGFYLSQKIGTLESECVLSIKLSTRHNPAVSLHDQVKAMIELIPRIVSQGDVFGKAERTKIYLSKILAVNDLQIGKALWAHLFEKVPKFTNLTIKKAYVQTLEQVIDALTDLAQKDTPQRSRLSMPREMHFIFVRQFGSVVFTKLVEYLRIRKTNGSPLKLLRFKQCEEIDETDLLTKLLIEDVVEDVDH